MSRWVLGLALIAALSGLVACGPGEPECDVTPRAAAIDPVAEDLEAVVAVTGSWQWNLYYDVGKGHNGTWTFTQEADNVTGTYESGCHEEQGTVKGFLQGNKIVINDGHIRFMGTVGEAGMAGTWIHIDDLTASPQDWDALPAVETTS